MCVVVKLVSVEHSRLSTPESAAMCSAVIMCHYALRCALKSVFSDHSDLLAKVLIILLSEQANTVALSCGENEISSKENMSVSTRLCAHIPGPDIIIQLIFWIQFYNESSSHKNLRHFREVFLLKRR